MKKRLIILVITIVCISILGLIFAYNISHSSKSIGKVNENVQNSIEENEILVMCSDGIAESNAEYENKELWLKYLLEQMETENVQKMADIILAEAIDNNYGIPKDDMTVIVCKIEKN